MSKDIRSYFTSLGSVKKRETIDVETKSEKKTKPQKKKRVAIILDSDDEDVPAPVKKQKSTADCSSKYFKDKKKTVADKPSLELKPVNASDVFGCDKVKRSATKTCKERDVEVQKNSKEKSVPVLTLDDGNDSDLEFAATLLQLDEIEAKANELFKKDSSFVVLDGCVNAAMKLSECKNNPKSKVTSLDSSTLNVQEKNKKTSEEPGNDSSKSQTTGTSDSKLPNGFHEKEEKCDGRPVKEDTKYRIPKLKKTSDIDLDEIPKSREKSEKATKSKRKRGIQYASDSDEDDNNRSRSKSKGNTKRKNENVKESKKTSPPKSKDTEDNDEPYWANDPAEKRRLSAVGYQRYLQREGPKHLGKKEIPTGKPNCLKGLVFVITGVLDSIERDAAAALIVECGGKVTSSLSRNTSYIVIGDDAGPSKVDKAQKLGTRQINEDELFNLIRTKSGLPSQDRTKSSPETKKGKKSIHDERVEKLETSGNKSTSLERVKAKETEIVKAKEAESVQVKDVVKSPPTKVVSKSPIESKVENFYGKPTVNTKEMKIPSSVPSSPSQSATSTKNSTTQQLPPSLLWVDKYRPTSIKSIIGQQGDRSNVKKLLNWLQNWHRNQFGGKKLVKPNPWARDDDGAYFRAALLSGPPGVGKTTSAHLVSKELGFDIVEFNASDTRSKKLLHEEVSELLSNKSLNDYFKGAHGKTTSKHILLMDEVDGMAGNEDRGGIQELIQLIKNSKVPILCMCNDVHHQKMRSLVGHCFDLRFQKPRVEQIRGAMQSVCFKEGVKVPPDVLTDMITGSNQDIRQVLHHLSLYSVKGVTQSGTKEVVNISKHVKLGPWDVMKKVFSAEEHKTMSINDKSDLFFHDYNISPLFVQENYLSVLPDSAKNNMFKRLDLIAQAANSICMGDTVERCIRSKNSWSLLPVQAMYASVIPGDLLEGHMTSQINFPSWLGKNSRRNKFDRLLQELHSHTRLSVSGNKQSLNLDYLPRLREAITQPLIQRANDGIPDAIEVLQAYHLLRTDIDSVMELSVWPGEQDPMSKIESKVKAALTRTYNKDLVLPYSTAMTVAKKKSVALTMDGDEEDEDEGEEENDDDLSTDAMIKAKKRPAAKKETAAGPSSSKRGRGRGKK